MSPNITGCLCLPISRRFTSQKSPDGRSSDKSPKGKNAALYQPLGQSDIIRLLKLSRYRLEAGLPLELSEYSLVSDGLPQFFGLSYCWGTPDRSQTLLVNQGVLSISANLLQALNELAALPEFDNANFWIDQICVDQEDLEERSHQVTLMHRIYRSASRTVIWFSSSLDADGNAKSFDKGWAIAETIHTLGHTRKEWGTRHSTMKVPLPRTRSMLSSWYRSEGLPAHTDPCWEELKDILSNPWFSRIWVSQEAALSKDPAYLVHAGLYRQLSHILWTGAWLIYTNGPFDSIGIPYAGISFKVVSDVNTMFNIVLSAQSSRLEVLLSQTGSLTASDPRDKVFALLGLATSASLPQTWAPDYRHSAAEVYRDLGRALMQESGRLILFETINYNYYQHNQPLSGLPSWAPNLLGRPEPAVEPTKWERDDTDASHALALKWREEFYACRGIPAKVLQQNDMNVLTLRGLEIDEVTGAFGISPGKTSLLRCMEVGLAHFRLRGEESMERFAHEFLESAAVSARSEVYPTLWDLHAYLVQHGDDVPNRVALEQLLPQADESDAREATAENVEMLIDAYPRIPNSTLFFTKRDMFGLGPHHTLRGNAVVVLYGCEAPCILRAQDNDYLIMGLSYIPGYMKGECIDRYENGEIEEKWFALV